MTDSLTRIRILVASPADTAGERTALDGIVAELNRGIANTNSLVLELVRWETHVRPGIGSDAQDVINRQLPEIDVLLAVFWKRLGTPTPRAASGTAEELERAIELWHQDPHVEILVYFNQEPYAPQPDDLEQISALLGFREHLQDNGLLIWEYEGVDDFAAKVRGHLTNVAIAFAQSRPSVGSISSATYSPWSTDEPARLATEIDIRKPAAIQALAADLRDRLRAREFGTDCADRAATVLLELLANSREHSGVDSAIVEIELYRGATPHVTLQIDDGGTHFDLGAALAASRQTYERGEREHGLLTVERLSSYLYLSDSVSCPGSKQVCCSLFDISQRPVDPLPNSPRIKSVVQHFDVPRCWWIGSQPYSGSNIDEAMRFALKQPASRVINLYLGSLRASSISHVGIGFTGNVVPSEALHEFDASWISDALPRARSPRPVEAALEVHLNQFFDSGRVFMYSFDAGLGPEGLITEWADRWDLPCFTEPAGLRSYLDTLPR